MGEFSHVPAWLPRHARSNCCQVRLHQGKFNNHILLSSMNIVLQLSELRLSTALSPCPPEGRVTALCGLYWGVPLDRIWFWSLSLNMLHYFMRIFPNRVWSVRSTFHFVFLSWTGPGCQTRSVTPTPKHWSKDPFSTPREPEGTGVARLCRA